MASREADQEMEAADRLRSMKILLLARHFSYLRNFESAVVELAERGHTIHLTADREESLGGAAMVERLAALYPQITVGWTPRSEERRVGEDSEFGGRGDRNKDNRTETRQRY